MMYPLVVDLAAEGVRVSTSCRVLGFSTQAFYKWRKQPYSDAEWDDAHLLNELVDLHADDPEFGYRFLHDELRAAGHGVSANRVHRLCRQNQLWSVFAKKKGLGRKAGPPVHDDLVKRHFKAEAPDQVWLTDITEHWTAWVLPVVATLDLRRSGVCVRRTANEVLRDHGSWEHDPWCCDRGGCRARHRVSVGEEGGACLW